MTCWTSPGFDVFRVGLDGARFPGALPPAIECIPYGDKIIAPKGLNKSPPPAYCPIGTGIGPDSQPATGAGGYR
jgi:hypothetical protein